MPTLIRDVVDFCVPALCAGCGNQATRSAFLCDGCSESLDKLKQRAACFRCAAPLALPSSPCPFCKGEGIPGLARVAALGPLEGTLKHLIHRLKYQRQWAIAERLAEDLAELPRAKTLIEMSDAIIAVPLHRRRQFTRGYNQAQVMAKWLGRRFHLPVLNVIRRSRSTPSQTQMTSVQSRFRNMARAFEVRDVRALAGRRLLLVDDVMTSGATLRSLARVLERGVPARCSALVLARADARRRSFTSV